MGGKISEKIAKTLHLTYSLFISVSLNQKVQTLIKNIGIRSTFNVQSYISRG